MWLLKTSIMNWSICRYRKAIVKRILLLNKAFLRVYPRGDKPDRQPVAPRRAEPIGVKDRCQQNGRNRIERARQTHALISLDTGQKVASAWNGRDQLPMITDRRKTDIELRQDEWSRERKTDAWLPYTVYNKIVQKLKPETVEGTRMNFELDLCILMMKDATAVQATNELAGMKQKIIFGLLIGIRIKPFTEDLKSRGVEHWIFFSYIVWKNKSYRKWLLVMH